MADAKPKDETPGKPPKARKGGMLKTLGLGLAFILAAGAAGLGATVGVLKFGSSYLPGKAAESGHAPSTASLVLPIEYVEIDTPFTSNLVDTGRYLQVRLSVGTTAGPAVVAAVTRHKPAIISAVLGVLGEATEADVADRAAKDAMRVKVREAINAVLRGRGVAGAVDEVFFTSLVIQ
ncbi:hypothetical protein GCM10007973_30280 [Polymorphobacter multimanifer]|uniref:Flagellar protein FliL n=1 Tax=Polymorphobacter multimanifer TaxID=1070431 RepID=A0A841L0I7_9SPHN|nr:flagellar basal body-associated FliL family protein [Polymorphobacter multimanifer]MBB6226339.1 flagellar FliL protein [Polymorphobacter multimanifer]GGI92011.1 hypothetical protein GCM10007973_30280 [Polymorphobacter multimanifer]